MLGFYFRIVARYGIILIQATCEYALRARSQFPYVAGQAAFCRWLDLCKYRGECRGDEAGIHLSATAE